MHPSPWQKRIQRTQTLIIRHPFAAEILGFYIQLARFQEKLHHHLNKTVPQPSLANNELGQSTLSQLTASFESFLHMAEAHGPKPLAELSRELRSRGQHFWSDLLQDSWANTSASDAQGFLALAFLQPYAELRRSCISPCPHPNAYALCPFCNRRPGSGVLRQMGDGASRSLICSFCVAEWEFRRIVCPGCGEENDTKLPVFTAADFDYIRVECCETCKTYLKTVDLTKNGLADPLADELASAPLDLWARDHGYAKLQSNILGM